MIRRLLGVLPALLLCAFGLFPSGGPGPVTIAPMCGTISGGCAEAWGVAERSVGTYSGPLFQITNGSSTLDIGQDANHFADMTTWSAFCGGMNTTSGGITTNAVCKVSKIYAEINGHGNDLVPAVFAAPFGPNCISGGNACACAFRYEAATGLPILYKTTDVCEYTLSGDAAATGITAGSNAISILYNGLPNTINNCCGSAGMAHAYNAPDTAGTDFMIGSSYGQGGPQVWNCNTTTDYCFGLDEEGPGDGLGAYTPPSPGPVVFVVNYDPIGNAVNGWINGSSAFHTSPPISTNRAAGTSVHVGGGGDLSQPAMTAFREFAITNTAVTQSDVTAATNQIKTNFNGLLTFGDLH